jgi:hypothetical protein
MDRQALTSPRHSSLQHTQAVKDIKTTISAKQTAVTGAIAETDERLAEVNGSLGALCLADMDEGETEADRASATKQVAVELKALGESRKTLEELHLVIQRAAANFGARQVNTVTFGNGNTGQQVGVNSGSISATFGRKE